MFTNNSAQTLFSVYYECVKNENLHKETFSLLIQFVAMVTILLSMNVNSFYVLHKLTFIRTLLINSFII